MKHHFYPLALGTVLFSGCSKDNTKASVALEGEYQTGTTIVAANPIAMYTKNGLVNNQQLVDRFLVRSRLGILSYFSRADVAITDGSTLKLTIEQNGQATLASTHLTNTTSTKAEVTTRSPQYFVLANLDSASTLSSGAGQSRCGLLADLIRNVNPVKRCKALPPVTGYSQSCQFRALQVITIKEGKLFLPMFSWAIRAGNQSYTCGLSSANERNTFNLAILNQLADGDTIVVQERELPLIKK